MKLINKSEKRRFLFFEIGLIVALFAALTAFEWKTSNNNSYVFDESGTIVFDTVLPPITTPPEPPKPKQEIKHTILNIVEGETEVDPEFKFEDVTQATPIMKYYVPEKQEEKNTNTDPVPFIKIERKPEFPGGKKAFQKYLQENIFFTETAREVGIEGQVIVSFTIDENGKVKDVILKRGIGGGCDELVLNAIKNMPDWTPGMQRTKKVAVLHEVGINFTLGNH